MGIHKIPPTPHRPHPPGPKLFQIKPAKNKFTCCDFTNFSKKVSVILLISISGHLHALYIKNLSSCYLLSISRNLQSNFWRVCIIWSNPVASNGLCSTLEGISWMTGHQHRRDGGRLKFCKRNLSFFLLPNATWIFLGSHQNLSKAPFIFFFQKNTAFV